MSSGRLIYFNGKGRAELSRLMIAYAGLPIEDVRVTGPEFAELKPSLPAGQLPVLQLNGTYYCQSKAIEQYIARKANLYPSDTELAFSVDIVREHVQDAAGAISAFVYGPADRKEAAKADLDRIAPAVLGRLEKFLEASGETFTGKGFSYADFAVFNLLDYLDGIDASYSAPFGGLKGLAARIAAVPSVAAYLAARP